MIFTIENKFLVRSAWFMVEVRIPDSEYENYALKSIELAILPPSKKN